MNVYAALLLDTKPASELVVSASRRPEKIMNAPASVQVMGVKELNQFFATIDLSTGYKVNENVTTNIGVTNLLNTEQIEFVGSPSIGRLISLELKVHVPNRKY